MTGGGVVGGGAISLVPLAAITSLHGGGLVGGCGPHPHPGAPGGGKERVAGVPGPCQVLADRAAEVGETYGVPWFTDHAELLATVHPQVVHICTPHNQHVPVAIDSLDAGVAVLVEKPVAHTVCQAERLIAANRAHPGVQVG